MAIIIINFERSFKGEKTAGVTPSDIETVVISEAKRNQRIKLGTALVSENASFVLFFRDCHNRKPKSYRDDSKCSSQLNNCRLLQNGCSM